MLSRQTELGLKAEKMQGRNERSGALGAEEIAGLTYRQIYYRAHRERILAQQNTKSAKRRRKNKYLLHRGENIRRRLERRQRNWPAECVRLSEWRRRRRAKIVSALGGRCARCEYATCPELLQFDHISARSKKTKDPKWEALKHPSKFQLLCPSCHRIKTVIELRLISTDGVTQLRNLKYKTEAIELLGGFCAKCGCGEIDALEFDHIVPHHNSEKGPNVYRVLRAPEKFRLLCATCHRLKSNAELVSWYTKYTA